MRNLGVDGGGNWYPLLPFPKRKILIFPSLKLLKNINSAMFSMNDFPQKNK